jgi:hypothetical protein
MDIKDLTKGQIITNTQNGRRYTILSKQAHDAGTYLTDPADPNYVIMVRPIHVGRAFDLFLSQGQLDNGTYTVAPAAK